MSDRGPKSSRVQRIIGGLAVIIVLCVCGCGDFFDKKPTEIETRQILDELERVKENPHIKNPLPEMYRGPAKKIAVKDGVKLFYFTKHHTVDILSGLIASQLSYKVSLSSPTNQLIIHCPNDEEADKVLEFLDMVDVPPIQVNIDCLILERYADVTMDWETTILVENLLGEGITLGGTKAVEYVTSNVVQRVVPQPIFPGAALREEQRRTFGLDFGYWRDKGILGHQFRAVVDILESRGYLKVLMNPTIETVNGQTASIVSRENAPLQQIVTKEGVDPYSLTKYQWVEDTLEVTPRVFADGSISLRTKIGIGSRSKPEGVVQTSIITERNIDLAENRIKPGDSLIVGGIRKSEKRVVIRGIPFFKDIPIIGVLFSSKDFEERATEVIFILTPSISSGGIEHAKVVEEVRKKYATPEYKTGLERFLTDPFGSAVYTEHVEQKAAQAEFERAKSEMEKTQMLEEAELVKGKLLETAEEVITEKAKARRVQTEAEKAREEAEKAKAEKAKAEAEAEKSRAEAEKAREDAEKARDEKARAEAEAEKAKAEDANEISE